jgi:hypothetical protein
MNFKNYLIEDAIKYNLENDIPLSVCVFRRESEGFSEYYSYLRENMSNFSELSELDKEIISTDIGVIAEYEGEEVYLDLPFAEESILESEPELNSPKRSNEPGTKKYYVYVKNDKGNVIKVRFGDEKGGLTAKINDEEARKSFVARHNCAEKTDKTTPGYWACRLPWYASELGLSNGGKFFW